MALFLWEMKKIWRPVLLLAILFIGVVYYPIRPGFYLDMTDHDVIGSAELQLSIGWLKQYGSTIDRLERAELEDQLIELKEDFARQITNVSGASEAGITGYDSYLAWEDAFYEKEDPPKEERALHQSLLDNTNVYTIGMLISFMDNYDRLAAGGSAIDTGASIDPPSPAAKASIRRITQAEENKGVFLREGKQKFCQAFNGFRFFRKFFSCQSLVHDFRICLETNCSLFRLPYSFIHQHIFSFLQPIQIQLQFNAFRNRKSALIAYAVTNGLIIPFKHFNSIFCPAFRAVNFLDHCHFPNILAICKRNHFFTLLSTKLLLSTANVNSNTKFSSDFYIAIASKVSLICRISSVAVLLNP